MVHCTAFFVAQAASLTHSPPVITSFRRCEMTCGVVWRENAMVGETELSRGRRVGCVSALCLCGARPH